MLLQFTIPDQTTDGQPIRAASIRGSLCRQHGSNGPCIPVDTEETRSTLNVSAIEAQRRETWTDRLPASLASGAQGLIAYRIELRNDAGRSAGWSDPSYALSGEAPAAISAFAVTGTRFGTKLNWKPSPGEGDVLLERTVAQPAEDGQLQGPIPASGRHADRKKSPADVWLQADPGNASASATVDGTVLEGIEYRYVAVRRKRVQVGGRTLELRSSPSEAVSFTWHDVYPPASPTGLTGLGYALPVSGEVSPSQAPHREVGYAVDLVWQPVDDPRLAGYLVYREAMSGSIGQPGKRLRLTPEPVTTPGFHDATSDLRQRYRYGVTAVDSKGQESRAVETTIEPGLAP